jgi:hypothetical protein
MFLEHTGFLNTLYDKTCTEHIDGKLDFESAKIECLKNSECLGIDRQNIRSSSSCGNRIITLCKKFALRGTCDCNSPKCNPEACSRFKTDKLTCIDLKGMYNMTLLF